MAELNYKLTTAEALEQAEILKSSIIAKYCSVFKGSYIPDVRLKSDVRLI